MLETQTLAFGYNETIKTQDFSRPQKPNVLYWSSAEIGKYEAEKWVFPDVVQILRVSSF